MAKKSSVNKNERRAKMAKQTAPPKPEITALHVPPIFMAETSHDKGRSHKV